MSWRIAALFFALGVLTRIPFQTEFLWAHDSVLYARAIERFDPLDQRPQAPGYLYYVLLIRALHAVVGDPNRAMTIVSLLAGASAVALLYIFAARLYDERTARASGAFLLTAVTFWAYGGVAYPYTLLAALSIGCALLFWRALRAEAGRGARLALASVAYGIAIGFRTDLAVFLAPLWLMTGLASPVLAAVASAAVVAALILIWFFASAALDGGTSAFLEAIRAQGAYVEATYSVLGERGPRALATNAYELARYVGRGLYFLAPLLVALPLSVAARRIELSDRRRTVFVLLWTFTPLAIYLPIHVGEYGYVFSMLPGLCVLAARGAIAVARGLRMPRSLPGIVTTVALANAAIFLVSDSPLSARDVIRRDRGLAEKIEWLEQNGLKRATIVTAYDALLIEHYVVERYGERGWLLPPVLWKYDPAVPRIERPYVPAPCDTPRPEQCPPPVLVAWDDLLRVRGPGWEEVRLFHGSTLRIARDVSSGVTIITDGLSVELAR